MLVKEIIAELQKCDPKQFCQVAMQDKNNPNTRYQIGIQKIYASPGWHTDPENPRQNIVRFLIHEENRILEEGIYGSEGEYTKQKETLKYGGGSDGTMHLLP